MRDKNKLEELNMEKYGKDDLRIQVLQRATDEYNTFIDSLYQMYPNEIVSNACEKTCKEEMVEFLKHAEFTDEEYKLMLERERILGSFYMDVLYYRKNKSDSLLELAFKDTLKDLRNDPRRNEKDMERE
ncbi:MAG: DUF3848 domain-containing protein [Clostridia bacterium]|nr:DUF3848 domain-containing protein [Clostridia bacterium]